MKTIDYYGQPYAQEVLKMLVDMHRNPTKYHSCGVHIPRGILLVGAPGIGKTLFAHKAAEILNQELLVIKPSTDFLSDAIGKTFQLAREKKHCIVLLDELFNMIYKDDKTEGQLLAELDSQHDFLVIATTSAHEYEMAQFEALTRPGRFDIKIRMSWPSYEDRLHFFDHKLRESHVEYDSKILAEITVDQSYAFMQTLINQIKMRSIYLNQPLTHPFVYEVKEQLERYSNDDCHINHKELYAIAIHEMGHAVSGILNGRTLSLIELSKKSYRAKTTFQPFSSQTTQDIQIDMDITIAGYAAAVVVFAQHFKGSELDFEETRSLFSILYRSSLSIKNKIASTYVDNALKEQTIPEYRKLYQTTITSSFRRVKRVLKPYRNIMKAFAMKLVHKTIFTKSDISELVQAIHLKKQSRVFIFKKQEKRNG